MRTRWWPERDWEWQRLRRRSEPWVGLTRYWPRPREREWDTGHWDMTLILHQPSSWHRGHILTVVNKRQKGENSSNFRSEVSTTTARIIALDCPKVTTVELCFLDNKLLYTPCPLLGSQLNVVAVQIRNNKYVTKHFSFCFTLKRRATSLKNLLSL